MPLALSARIAPAYSLPPPIAFSKIAGFEVSPATGGRDLNAKIGAVTMLQGIELLANDPGTKVIAIVSKPPAPEVATKVLAALQAARKPAVVLFLGSALQVPAGQRHPIRTVQTLVDCAAAAVELAGVKLMAPHHYAIPRKPTFAASQKYLRALYSGGTFAYEAQIVWAKSWLDVRSNVHLKATLALPDARKASLGHTALDLGDDAFTVGRPHPMIDQSARIERLLQEAADPSVRVIVIDVVIGWGAHPDPAGELAIAVAQAKRSAAKAGRELAVIGFVCGTELDPQVLAKQEATLRAVGMVLAGNSANAAWLAGEWVQ